MKIIYSIYGLFRRCKRLICTMIAKPRIAKHGHNLRVNGLSLISRKAYMEIGNNVNFNGIRIVGGVKL